jgi:Flp pilus assembly pilin Flp
MQTYLNILRQRMQNEQGAEIVEWVLWVGGIALLAGVLFTTVSGALNTTISNIVTNIKGVST